MGTSITINRDAQIAAERIAVVNALLEHTSRGPMIHNSFFSRCERDESGRCLPGSGSSPVKKGALIGGGIGLLTQRSIPGGLAGAGIGAGIGALVKRRRTKKRAKEARSQKEN